MPHGSRLRNKISHAAVLFAIRNRVSTASNFVRFKCPLQSNPNFGRSWIYKIIGIAEQCSVCFSKSTRINLEGLLAESPCKVLRVCRTLMFHENAPLLCLKSKSPLLFATRQRADNNNRKGAYVFFFFSVSPKINFLPSTALKSVLYFVFYFNSGVSALQHLGPCRFPFV